MQLLTNQWADERPDHVLVTDQYVDVNENIREESYVDEMSGAAKNRFVYDVVRYQPNEYIKVVSEENADLRGAVLELSDIVLSGGVN